MRRKRSILVIILFIVNILVSQLSSAQIKTVAFQQLDSLQKIEKKPVMVFLHTSWCKYCGSMKNTTLKNGEVVKALNEKYYFVSLDIEEKTDISFRGHTFRYKPNGPNTGVHELAEQLGTIYGQLAYPGICFLSAGFEIIYQKEGYVSPKDLVLILQNITNQ
jgi:thioredoxin-related protein